MAAQVKIGAVMRSVDLSPAEWKQILNITGFFRIVRKLLVIVKSQLFGGQS